MKFLAHWIYADAQLQTGVSECQLISKAAEYLQKWRLPNVDEARATARDFIGFCKGRAWVFTDTGTTPEGESLYQFTHSTFLEYFTAAHLVRTHETPQLLASMLLPRIEKSEWDVVAQLAVQIQSRQLEDGADKIFNTLLNAANHANIEEKTPTLSFLARCLKFVTPSPEIIKETVAASVDHCIDVVSEFSNKQLVHVIVSGVFDPLFSVANENAAITLQAQLAIFSNSIAKGINDERRAALDLCYFSKFISSEARRPPAIRPLQAFLTDQMSGHIRELGLIDPKSAGIAFNLNLISCAEWINSHGLEGIFAPIHSDSRYFAFPPFVNSLFTDKGPLDSTGRLDEISETLEQLALPWARSRELGNFNKLRFPKIRKMKDASLSPAQTFATFALFATLLESGENRGKHADTLLFVMNTKNAFIVLVRELLMARYVPELTVTLDSYQFSEVQARMARDWISKRVKFVVSRRISEPPRVAAAAV